MKFLRVIPLVCFVLLAAALVTSGCISVSSGDKDGLSVSPAATPAESSSGSCGFTTCHGLDLACGSNAPEVCTMEYRLGDKCRQYARCDTTGGKCLLVTTAEFTSCKDCVNECESKTASDAIPAFECEAKC